MSLLQGFLVVVGGIGGMVALCALSLWIGKQFSGVCYDERQQVARGNAAQISLVLSLVYYLAVFCFLAYYAGEQGRPPVEPSLLLFVGVLIQIMLFHICCLLTHAALPFSKSPLGAILGWTSLGALYLVQLLHTDTLTLTGEWSQGWISLIAGVSFLCLAVIQLIALLWKDKE